MGRLRVLAALVFVAAALAAAVGWLGRGGELPALKRAAGWTGSTAPFNVIYRFYTAAAANDWETVRRSTSDSLWSYLVSHGFVREWEERRRLDPTVAFSLFLVKAFTVDERAGTAWALGEVRWTGGAGRPADTLQTVFLERVAGRWLVTRIDSRSPVEVTAEFYAAIQRGDWLTMRRLTTPEYWGRLVARGIIVALQQEWAETGSGVYLVLHILDLAEGRSRAWVSADVLWRPLTLYERETRVSVELLKTPGGWQIAGIRGHWEEAK